MVDRVGPGGGRGLKSESEGVPFGKRGGGGGGGGAVVAVLGDGKSKFEEAGVRSEWGWGIGSARRGNAVLGVRRPSSPAPLVLNPLPPALPSAAGSLAPPLPHLPIPPPLFPIVMSSNIYAFTTLAPAPVFLRTFHSLSLFRMYNSCNLPGHS